MSADDIAALRAELRAMQARIVELEGQRSEPIEEVKVGRRGMLRHLGTAAAGAAVGGLAFAAKPAAAADDDPIIIGAQNTADSTTMLVTNSGYSASPLTGAFHVTNNAGGTNLNAALSCISAYASGSGGGGQSIAFFGSGSSVGAKLDGPVPLKLTDNSGSAAPTSASGQAGMFKVVGGELWYCSKTETGSNNDAVWLRLAAATGAGSFVALSPTRVADTRTTGGGIISQTESRVVSVKDGRDLGTGAVNAANIVPAGARAVTYNLTVTATTGGGYLALTPGDAGAFSASAINWSGPGTTIANSGVIKLDGNRQVKVWGADAGAPSSAHFIIDITGYYM